MTQKQTLDMHDRAFDFDLDDLYEKLKYHIVPTLPQQQPVISEETLNSQNKQKNFPNTLYEMLQQQNENNASEIISWLPNGAGFVIHKKKDFEDVILPTYFKGIKFRSFQRQLNIYGFERQEIHHESCAYKHNFFVKNQIHLINNVKRIPVKKKHC